jgi:hypothetical protein
MRSLAAEVPRGRRLIAVLLLASAAMDLTRCGLTVMTARHPMPAYGLAAAGLAVAALSVPTVRGCQTGPRWAGWAAFRGNPGWTACQRGAGAVRGSDRRLAGIGITLAVIVLAPTTGRSTSTAGSKAAPRADGMDLMMRMSSSRS